MDLSIVIVNTRTRDFLLDCLTYIYCDRPSLAFEVWVIDNNSCDGSVEEVKERFREVKLITVDRNLGFSKAANIGLRNSQGRYALLLNPDTKFHSDVFKKLVEFMDSHLEAGVASPKLLNPDGGLQLSCFYFPTLLRQFFQLTLLVEIIPSQIRKRFSIAPERYKGIIEVDWLIGPCMILRRKALDDVDGFDENFFIYTEDIDLCYRMKKFGWKIFSIPDAEVVHIGNPGDKTRWGGNKEMIHQRNLSYFFRKHYGRTRATILRCLQIFGALLRIGAWSIVYLVNRWKRKKAKDKISIYREWVAKPILILNRARPS